MRVSLYTLVQGAAHWVHQLAFRAFRTLLQSTQRARPLRAGMTHRRRIVARCRLEVSTAEESDFVALHADDAIDAVAAITAPGALLYTVNLARGTATFVDVGGAEAAARVLRAPFAYNAMYRQATHVFDVTLDDLIRGADERLALNRGQTNMCFIWSVARSGSTLMCRALGAHRSVLCASEPDVLVPFVIGRADSVTRERFEALLRAAVLTLLPVQDDSPRLLVLKPRSHGIRLAPALHRIFPRATALFSHRNALACAASMERAFSTMPMIAVIYAMHLVHKYVRRVPFMVVMQRDELDFAHNDVIHGHRSEREFVDAFTPFFSRSDLPFCGAYFATTVTSLYRYLSLQERGVDVHSVRYETFIGERRAELCRAMLQHAFGDKASWWVTEDDVAAVVRASKEDSQKGTVLARDAVAQRARRGYAAAGLCESAKNSIAAVHVLHPRSAPMLPLDDDLPGAL